ncbi:MAG: serine/threonine protein kinase [Chroococcidiopsidaceae cyanobacterium CP_BM_RX_35]|nr:serine/threonine protein kinase [Chroococcidiopsidaceae cyanobacterium CP_BM_RX_35]
MSNSPDFSQLGYQVIRELGRNYVGGRVTYLAADTNTQLSVVVKRFQFPGFISNWSGFEAYEREIQVLRSLNHPSIPRYLKSFETSDGFCLVQEFKNAQSLAIPRSFDADEIKQIAAKVLEILVYLQNRCPAVIHRDIKPENILVDEHLQVYLVDFGFARIGGGEVGMSSVALGTLGFMPPEQLYNRQLSEATDLYGLGATLICLLTQTKSTAINTLIDANGRIDFQSLIPKLSRRWINWLEKLVQPNPQNRYASASAALKALEPIALVRQPEAKLSTSSLIFTATSLGEKSTQIITVSNSAPGTLLEGNWEVAPHLSDPPHTPDNHAWISFRPSEFLSNHIKCEVIVDTSKLMANQLYSRQVLLHTNSDPESLPLTIKVQTALLFETQKTPYLYLALLCVLSGFLAGWIPSLVSSFGLIAHWAIVGAIAGAAGGATITAVTANARIGERTRVKQGFLLGALLGALMTSGVLALVYYGAGFNWFSSLRRLLGGIVIGAIAPVLEVNLIRASGVRLANQGFSSKTILTTLILTVGLGSSSGIHVFLGGWNQVVLAAILGTGLPLAGMIAYPPFKRSRLMAKYRQSAQYLIKP